MRTEKPNTVTPTWSDVKSKLSEMAAPALLKLIQDIYAISKDNKAFLHTRFGLSDDPLGPYKDTITKWINPPDYRKPHSVAKAKKAISDYKKALGQPEGLAELSVFYCEEALYFITSCGMEDEDFYNSLTLMFEQALKCVLALPATQQGAFLTRLTLLRHQGDDIGWGIGDDFEYYWFKYGLTEVR